MTQSFHGPKAKAEACARPSCGHSPQAHALIGRGTCDGDNTPCRCIAYWFPGQPDPLAGAE